MPQARKLYPQRLKPPPHRHLHSLIRSHLQTLIPARHNAVGLGGRTMSHKHSRSRSLLRACAVLLSLKPLLSLVQPPTTPKSTCLISPRLSMPLPLPTLKHPLRITNRQQWLPLYPLTSLICLLEHTTLHTLLPRSLLCILRTQACVFCFLRQDQTMRSVWPYAARLRWSCCGHAKQSPAGSHFCAFVRSYWGKSASIKARASRVGGAAKLVTGVRERVEDAPENSSGLRNRKPHYLLSLLCLETWQASQYLINCSYEPVLNEFTNRWVFTVLQGLGVA